MLINILAFLFVFTVIALVHEFGHLIFAKRAGIRVYELALGFGPKLFSFKYHNTIYAVNLIPILGYVKIAGEGESEEDKECPDNEKFFNKTPGQRFMALFSGALFNIVFAFLVLIFVFSLNGIPAGVSNEVGIVNANSPAAKAGLLIGDQIVAINGQRLKDMESIIDYIHKSPEKPLLLSVIRQNIEIKISATPKHNKKMNVSLLGFSPKPIYEKVNLLQAIIQAFIQTILMISLIFYILGQLIIGAVSFTDLAGPVGIAQITGKYTQVGIFALLNFTAFLSVNVGVFNLLPIPALDGGHLLFILIEWIRRKGVSPDIINKFNYWGFIGLLALMAAVTLNDLLRLLGGR